MNPFERTEMLFGPAAMARLRDATVTVIGLGAVGSYAVEGLARAGVGHLRLVDFDTVKPSNINRQLYALHSTLGRPKAELAATRVADINPACRVETLPLFADLDSADRVLDRPGRVIDAIDSVGPKVRMLAECVRRGHEVVSVMGAAARTRFDLVRTGDITTTRLCPLARFVRRRLKREFGIESGIFCIYSEEPAPTVRAAPETETYQRGRPRRPIGSFSCMTGIFGLLAAREVILRIAGHPAAAGAATP